MYEILHAIIVDSSAAFAWIMTGLFALIAAMVIGLFVWLHAVMTVRGQRYQLNLQHRETMAKLQAEHLLGHDVSQRRVGQVEDRMQETQHGHG